MITDNEILEGNKLIAEFMGWYYSTSFEGLLPNHWVKENGETATDYLHTELIFHSSWDWLMPVVEKIESLEYSIFFNIIGNEANVTIHNEDGSNELLYEYSDSSKTKIEAVWLAVVEFIKWYNQNKVKC